MTCHLLLPPLFLLLLLSSLPFSVVVLPSHRPLSLHLSFCLFLCSIPTQGTQALFRWHPFITPTPQVQPVPVWPEPTLTAALPAPSLVPSSSSPPSQILRTSPAYLRSHPFRCAHSNHVELFQAELDFFFLTTCHLSILFVCQIKNKKYILVEEE